MASSRNSAGYRLAVRSGRLSGYTDGRPGWSQMARQLSDAGFEPSWGDGVGVSDGTLRDLYGKQRADRFKKQPSKRDAHRAEIDRFITGEHLNRQKLTYLSDEDVSRQRKAVEVVYAPGERAGKGHYPKLPSVRVGTFDLSATGARNLSRNAIRRTMLDASQRWPGADWNLRVCFLVDTAAVVGTNWEQYVQYYLNLEATEHNVIRKRGQGVQVVQVNMRVSTNITQLSAYAAAQATNGAGLARWSQRFVQQVFQEAEPVKVIGFGLAPLEQGGLE